jgi:hypothetical protein
MFSQLITNGDFRYNVDGWTASNSANTATWSDGKIRITANTASNNFGIRHQGFATQVGKRYKGTATVIGGTCSGRLGVGSSTGSANIFQSSFSSSTFNVEFEFDAVGTTTYFILQLVGGDQDEYCEYDNIRIAKQTPFNDIIKPYDVPTPIFNDIIRTYAGEEPWQAK